MKKILSVIFCIVFLGLQTVTVFAYTPGVGVDNPYSWDTTGGEEEEPLPFGAATAFVTAFIVNSAAMQLSNELYDENGASRPVTDEQKIKYTFERSLTDASNHYTRSRYDNMTSVEAAREMSRFARASAGFTDEALAQADAPPVSVAYQLPQVSSLVWEENTDVLQSAFLMQKVFINNVNFTASSKSDYNELDGVKTTDFGNDAYWVLKSTCANYGQTVTLTMYNGEHTVTFQVLGVNGTYDWVYHSIYNPVCMKLSNGAYGLYFPYYIKVRDTIRKAISSPVLIDGVNYCYYNSTKKQYYAMINGVEVYLPATYLNPAQYAYDLLLGDSAINVQESIIVKNPDGTYSNKETGVVYDPSKDVDRLLEGKTGTITYPRNKVIETTINEYMDAYHKTGTYDGVTTTYTAQEIAQALETVQADVVVQESIPADTAASNENAGFFSNILAWLKSIWQKLVDGFQSVVEWLRSIWRSIAGVGEDVGAIADSITGDSADADTEQERMKLSEAIVSRFPFCLAWDMKNVLSALNAEPIPPKWEIPFQISMFNIDETVTIDLTGETYTKWFTAFKWFIFVGFVLCLITGTLYFIRN